MTLCSVCGAIVPTTVRCYDGAPRCLPCAAAAGFEWHAGDAVPAVLYQELGDPPPPRWRPRRGAPAHRTPPAPRLHR